MHGIELGEAAKRLAQLSSVFRLDSFIDRRFDACSSGMKQRLALARAFLHRPRLLLLDEPTRSIDPVESQSLHTAIEQLVTEEKTAVLLVTHDLAEAEKLCRRFLVMRSGQVGFDGSPSELRRRGGDVDRIARYTVRLERSVGRLGAGTWFGPRSSRRERSAQ